MHDEARTGKSHPPRVYRGRDLELARKVGDLPDSVMVGVEEVAALSAIAASSLRKPGQRAKMGAPEPASLGGRHLVWNLGSIRAWLRGSYAGAMERRVGRPTKAESIRRAQTLAEVADQ